MQKISLEILGTSIVGLPRDTHDKHWKGTFERRPSGIHTFIGNLIRSFKGGHPRDIPGLYTIGIHGTFKNLSLRF